MKRFHFKNILDNPDQVFRKCLMIIAILVAHSITFSQPPVRAHHTLIYDEKNNMFLMTGGSTPLDGGQRFNFFNDCWTYDGAQWFGKSVESDKRSGLRLSYDTKRGKIFSFGGYSGDSSLSDLRMLEDVSWKTISFAPGFKAAEPGFVYDQSRDRLVIFGGSPGRQMVNSDTWEWDGDKWIHFEGKGPDARQAFAMVYDSKRKKTVLFGGMGSTPANTYGDTWEYDGMNWIKLDVQGPSARMSCGYAYDEKKGMLIIFGGATASGFAGDTWGFDGKSWSKLSDSGPSPRVMGYMDYDKARDKTILFGGRVGWPNDVNDTWEWDGASWKQIK